MNAAECTYVLQAALQELADRTRSSWRWMRLDADGRSHATLWLTRPPRVTAITYGISASHCKLSVAHDDMSHPVVMKHWDLADGPAHAAAFLEVALIVATHFADPESP